MCKKIIILISLIFIISSCNNQELTENQEIKNTKITCQNPYQIGNIDMTNLKLKGVVINNEIKNITPPIAGNISYLNCNVGKTVYPKTLIAKITPDFNNPNIANLSIQKASLVSQKANIESLKQTTILNLDKQINNLKEQIDILKKNIELTKKSSNISKQDLQKQIETLSETLQSLEKNLEILKKSKQDSLKTIETNKNTIHTNIINLTKDNLLKIDEIFGITKENKDKNDRYEDYLGKKNIILLGEVENIFRKLNNINIDKLSDEEISQFLGDLIILDNKAKDSIKNSIPNIYFSQKEIDSFYNLFLNYGENITNLKNSWDNLGNTKQTTINNFDSQISSLQNQITTTKNNLENLQKNKIGGIDVSSQLQLSNLESQLKTLKSNLDNLISNKKSQSINFDNQILQLDQSISSLNSNLSSRNIYAGVTGIVKQKLTSVGNIVGPNTGICQIIPNKKSQKIKIYSPVELNIGDKLTFEFNGNPYEVVIENALVYKDQATGNYIYESNYLDKNYFKSGEVINLSFENNNKEENKEEENYQIIIPVSYVENKIDGNFIKALSGSLVVEKKVELGDINGNSIEIKSGLENIKQICK